MSTSIQDEIFPFLYVFSFELSYKHFFLATLNTNDF